MSIPENHILVLLTNPPLEALIENSLKDANFVMTNVSGHEGLEKLGKTLIPNLILLGEKVGNIQGMEILAQLQYTMPVTPVILVLDHDNPSLVQTAIHTGITDIIITPFSPDQLVRTIDKQLEKNRARRQFWLLESRIITSNLEKQLLEMEALTQLGQTITRSLELEPVLTAVVDAAARLTRADKGILLLVDGDNGDLYQRAVFNIQDNAAHASFVKVDNVLSNLVLKKGEPLLIDGSIAPGIFLDSTTKSLVYIPLSLSGRVVGLLGVENQAEGKPSFSDHELKLLNSLAEYTIIAIHNAGLYHETIDQLGQLESTLTHIQDGVILVDDRQVITFSNQAAREIFCLFPPNPGAALKDLFHIYPDLEKLFSMESFSASDWVEMTCENGQFFSAHLSEIPQIGHVVTLHDITPLKKLEQVKNEFVNTVSHDLRSPLTSILGYIDLIHRAGPLNQLQEEFAERIKVSIQNITDLVTDLLDLGRIEAGVDKNRGLVLLNDVINETLNPLLSLAQSKGIKISMELDKSNPAIRANLLQIKQLVKNLFENAVKYSSVDGVVDLSTSCNTDRVLLMVHDSGIGIPPADMPHIFEKFFRATNVGGEITGTGLGLSIVHSIVESHHGKIWATSNPAEGTTFWVSLPLTDSSLSESRNPVS